MHERDDLSCDRGYEFWLLEEARKRNPAIKTYALSWAVPAWVGNQTGYYSQDNIDYHIAWLNCTRQYAIGNIDYMGLSNCVKTVSSCVICENLMLWRSCGRKLERARVGPAELDHRVSACYGRSRLPRYADHRPRRIRNGHHRSGDVCGCRV